MISCPYKVRTCLCGQCSKSAAFEHCQDGYCIECLECEDAKEAVHNVYLCTGFKPRNEVDANEKG